MSTVEEYALRMFTTDTPTDDVDVAALVHTHAPLLFRVAHSVVRNRAEAEDVVQDAYVRVLHHRRTLRDVQNLRVWLVRITWNLAIDRRRSARTSQMDDAFVDQLASSSVSADVALQTAEEARNVLRAIDALPSAEREALVLSAMDGLDTADVAKVMKRSESSVRSLVFRARTRLRERMEKGKQR